ncbi:MFS transporter [Streptomyces sp. NPDC008343]|uniref:MFS transporter n=1 Tax=Streptomyces sp. NPDC008343 TaxID=3364828 RepID=UPI0036F0530B
MEMRNPVGVTQIPTARVYGLLLGLGVLDGAGYSLIAPVLPGLAERTGASATVMGLLVATFPLGMVAGFAVAGFAASRSTPTRLIVTGLLFAATGCLGFVFGNDLIVFAVARLVMGLGSGGLWLGITFAALAAWPGEEYQRVSRIYASYSVGGLLGPVLGSIPGIRGPFAAYLVFALMAVTPVLLCKLPPTHGLFTTDRGALRSHGFWLACAGIAFAVMALGLLEGVFPLHFGTQLTQLQIGLLYAATSMLVALSATLAVRWQPRRLLMASTAVVVAGFGVAGASSSAPVWIAALIVSGAGIGMANTGAVGLLLEAVPAQRIVAAMVLWSQIGILGYLVAPLLGGPAVDVIGYAAVAGVVSVPAAATIIMLTWRQRA